MNKAAENHTLNRFSAPLPEKRHIVALIIVFVLCIGVFFWAGYVYLKDATGISRREIVNDDYSTAAPLASGDEIRQEIYAEGRLYGVNLNIATYGRVARGNVNIKLQNSAGQVVAQNTTPMVQLLDNTFHRFIFDNMIDAQNGEAFTLVITAEPETADDVIGFYKSDGAAQSFVAEGENTPHYPLDGFTLYLNGEKDSGTLALQYIVQYSGMFIVRAYSFFAALLTVFFLLLYYLIFAAKAPAHLVFILCGLVLGFVFMFLIPPRTAPDEYSHICYSYYYSNVILGQAQNDWANGLAMRAGDAMVLHRYDFDATNIFAYQEMYEGLFAKDPGGMPVEIYAPLHNVRFPLLYAPQTAGVVLARLLGLGRVPMLLFGRFANLLFYTILTSRAIKRMPVAKPMLFCVAILPMSLQLAASFSYDTYVLALSFYFIACCLECIVKRETVGKRQIIPIAAAAVLLAPAKAVYLAILPLILFIPTAKFTSKKISRLAKGGVFAAAAAMWLFFNMTGLLFSMGFDISSPDMFRPPGYRPETSTLAPAEISYPPDAASAALQEAEPPEGFLPNGDAEQLFSIMYTVKNIPQALKVTLRTFWEQGALWLQGLVGGRLGEIIAVDIEVNWVFTIGLLAVLALSALPNSSDTLVLPRRLRAGGLIISAAVVALFMLACLTWTPINYQTIFGIQGRYFLPVLPLVLLGIRGHSLKFTKDPSRGLMFTAAVLAVLCQLDAFTTIIQM